MRHKALIRSIKVLNLFLMLIPFAICWYGYYASHVISPFYHRGNYLILFVYLLLYFLFSRNYEAFQVSIKRISEIIYSQCLAALIADVVMLIVICLLAKGFPWIVPMCAAFCMQCLVSTMWTLIVHRWYFRVHPPKESVIVYGMQNVTEPLLYRYCLDKKYHVRCAVSIADCLNDLSCLDGAETVFICGVKSYHRNMIMKHCTLNKMEVLVSPCIGDILLNGSRQLHMFHQPMMMVTPYNANPEYLFIKRLADIVCSLTALILLSPLMLGTAIAIKLCDGGPVFYSQVRLTLDGKRFNIYKFRSMRVDAEKDGIARLSTGTCDDRITPVGHVIRRFRLDELPQLFNILRGDLSICGPRPERPEIAEQYTKEMPEFALRLHVKAGLTGYAQVYGKYNSSPYEKLLMDLLYIARPSIIEDFKIILSTVKILFMPDSTEGVSEGQITASSTQKQAEKNDNARGKSPR